MFVVVTAILAYGMGIEELGHIETDTNHNGIDNGVSVSVGPTSGTSDAGAARAMWRVTPGPSLRRTSIRRHLKGCSSCSPTTIAL
jgi:hypothetical protein